MSTSLDSGMLSPGAAAAASPERGRPAMQGTLAMADVPVVILAGGKGTRLRPFTASFPKPLVPLGDMPILEVVLRQLAGKGFRHITLSLGHLAELIRAYVGARPWLQASLDIATIDEDRPSGTAGSLKRVPDLDRTFLAMNGDVLTNLDYADLVRAHKASGAILTIAVHRKEVCIDLGVLVSNGEGVLTGYLEKPSYTHEVSMGVYVYEPRVLEHIEDDKYLDFPSLVHKLLEAGEHVNLYRNDAFWLDIGRPADYAEAQDIFEREPERFGITRS